MEIVKIGVIGMGQMGRGIAEVCALSGFKVLVTDVDRDTINKSRSHIFEDLKKLEKKNKIKSGKSEVAIDLIISVKDFFLNVFFLSGSFNN